MAEAAQLLSRYGDLLMLLSLLPVLSDLKFGSMLRAQDISTLARKKEEAASVAASKDKKEKSGKDAKPAKGEAAAKVEKAVKDTPTEETCRARPPAWALALLLLAECCMSMQLLDPADKQVARAAGALARGQKAAKPGFEQALRTFERLLGDPDVYQLVRFASLAAGLGGLLANSVLCISDQEPKALGAPMATLRKAALGLLKLLASARGGLLALLGASFVFGHWSMLGRLIRKPAVAEAVRSSATLWRVLAAAGTAITVPPEGPMPMWALLQGAAGVARAAHVLVFERVSMAAVLDKGAQGGAAVATARCVLALEGFCLLSWFPLVVRRKRLALLLPILCLPCLAFAAGGPFSAPLEPFVEMAVQKLNVAMAVVALMLTFMGGFPTMAACLGLFQLLFRIHRLDTLKF